MNCAMARIAITVKNNGEYFTIWKALRLFNLEMDEKLRCPMIDIELHVQSFLYIDSKSMAFDHSDRVTLIDIKKKNNFEQSFRIYLIDFCRRVPTDNFR